MRGFDRHTKIHKTSCSSYLFQIMDHRSTETVCYCVYGPKWLTTVLIKCSSLWCYFVVHGRIKWSLLFSNANPFWFGINPLSKDMWDRLTAARWYERLITPDHWHEIWNAVEVNKEDSLYHFDCFERAVLVLRIGNLSDCKPKRQMNEFFQDFTLKIFHSLCSWTISAINREFRECLCLFSADPLRHTGLDKEW